MSLSGLQKSVRNRLNSSGIRRAYWAVANREVLDLSRHEEDFYRRLLVGMQPDDLIFDIGANVGSKTDIFLRLGARVIALEPDEDCMETLRDRFVRYRFIPRPVTLIGKAVSEKVGTLRLFVDGPGSAVNTANEKWAAHLRDNKESFKHGHHGLEFSTTKSVETTTLENLIELYGLPFFVKIDVEGHESSVLRGLDRPVPFLSFEVNLRVFKSEGIECVRLLQRIYPGGVFNCTADCASGFAHKEWLGSEELCEALNTCSDETIEVFWKTNCTISRTAREA